MKEKGMEGRDKAREEENERRNEGKREHGNVRRRKG